MNSNRAVLGVLPMARSGAELRGLLRFGFCAVLILATLWPLLWVAVPPLIDYPNHLARMWIIVHRADIPALAQNYVTHWRVLPNLAMELVVPPLSLLMPVEVAGRVFIALTMLGLVLGSVVLHRALFGRCSIWPIWSVLFVYNAVLFWGFLGCLFAIAVYLFVFAGWIATADWRPVPRILVFAAAGAVLCLMHLFAFGLYGLSVVAYELGRGWPTPKRLAALAVVSLQFLPGLLIWCVSLGEVASAYASYGGIASKLYALITPVDFGVVPAPLDREMWLAVGVFLVAAMLLRGLTLAREMRLPLLALLVAAALMPTVANGSAYADIRLPATLPFVVLAATQFTVSRKWLAWLLGGVAVFCFGLRIWTVSASWQDYDRWFNEFRSASAAIAPGARLLMVEKKAERDGALPLEKAALPGVPAALATMQPKVFDHLGALAVIDRAAFFPYLFTQAYPIDAAARNQGVAESSAVPVTPAELEQGADPSLVRSLEAVRDPYGQRILWRDWPHSFDYVLWLDYGDRTLSYPAALRPLAAGSFFTLYRVMRPPP